MCTGSHQPMASLTSPIQIQSQNSCLPIKITWWLQRWESKDKWPEWWMVPRRNQINLSCSPTTMTELIWCACSSRRKTSIDSFYWTQAHALFIIGTTFVCWTWIMSYTIAVHPCGLTKTPFIHPNISYPSPQFHQPTTIKKCVRKPTVNQIWHLLSVYYH
jgi:hypothetical protein